MTAVEYLEYMWTLQGAIYKNDIDKALEMEKEQIEKLWTNEEVFDMLYKTDKFLMIDLREYWKTIEK